MQVCVGGGAGGLDGGAVMQMCVGEGDRMVTQVWGKLGQESDAGMEGEGDRLVMQIGGT